MADAASTGPYWVEILRGGKLIWSGALGESLELGRRAVGEVAVGESSSADGQRVIVAEREETAVSRRHVRLEVVGPGVRVVNLSRVRSIDVDAWGRVAPGDCCEAPLPAGIVFADVRVQIAEEEAAPLLTLPQATRPPVAGCEASPWSDVDDRAALACVLDVLRHAASDEEFLVAAARGAVQIAGLDHAAVLLREANDWRVAATHAAAGEAEPWAPSRTMLAELLRQQRTLRRPPPRQAASLVGVQSLVAAPLLDSDGQVVGAVYGDRRADDVAAFEPISERDAVLVEMVACGAAAGLARAAEEKAALESQIQFERFFTPQLAQRLQRDPTLLEGRDAEISVLFCDIRGFSRISGRLGPRETMRWIGDVMQPLSECVLAHDGVLVDYLGDELMAMWGAPEPDERHATAAVAAAVDMLQAIARLDADLRDRLGEPLAVGVGVNSGPASVGNTGSRLKFKYGPLGETVNVASRAQGASKYAGVELVVTAATADRLSDEFVVRPLGAMRLVNIAEPVALFQAARATRPLREQFASFTAAWDAAIAGDLAQATRLLGDPADDPVARRLATRLAASASRGEPFDGVVTLPGK